MMAGPKTIYVRDADEEMWEEAKRIGEARYGGLAGFVATALRNEIERQKLSEAADGEIVVEICPERDSTWRKVRFRGRWLVEPSDSNTGIITGIAQTARGRIAVYSHNERMGIADIDDFDDLSDVISAGLVADEALAIAAEVLGEEYIQELDI